MEKILRTGIIFSGIILLFIYFVDYRSKIVLCQLGVKIDKLLNQ